MTTFARIVNGIALDCTVATSVSDLASRFNAEWLSRNPFSVVPDGTLHGAKSNGDGTYTNPPPCPAPPISYVRLDRGGRLEVISAVFTDARTNAIHDAFALQTGDVLKAAYRKFMSDTYKTSRDEIITLFTALRNADVPTAATKITVAEITAIADHKKWITG